VTRRNIIICRDTDELNHRAAEHFVDLAQGAILSNGRFTVALSGGSTPKGLYSLLATSRFSARLSWRQIHLFWGDERCVAPDHAESNFRMVQEALLAKISLPDDNVHRMRGEEEPALAAALYEAELRRLFALQPGESPRFDLVLLGLGDDGHTASLFPGSPALNETEHWVAPSYVERLHAHRLTLTFPVINQAAQIAFLVSGPNKAAVVKEILTGSGGYYPAGRVRPADGELCWFITKDAAGDAMISGAME
jgi:6-phosphogluconolactonase